MAAIEKVRLMFLDRLIPQMMLGWNILLCFSVLAIDLLTPLVLGPEFKDTILPLQILILGLSFNAIGRIYTGITNAFDLLNRVAFLGIAVSLLYLVGDVILIPILGITGAALSTVFAFAVTHQCYIWLINSRSTIGCENKRYRINLMSLLPFSTIVVCTVTESALLPLAVAILVSIVAILICRKANVFDWETWKLVGSFPMPNRFRGTIKRAYAWLCS